MGLDMYLEREVWLGAYFDHREVEGEVSPSINGKKVDVDPSKIETITEKIGYWRKANAIHGWFVDNVQGGEDDCGRYRVDLEQAKALLANVNSVLDNHDLASELLPSRPGFFFGNTEYDQWYFSDLELTKEILEAAIPFLEAGDTVYYHSSW